MENEATKQKCNSDLAEDLLTKLGHLSAMTAVISGAGHRQFDRYNEEIRGDYLWACADLAREAHKMAENLGSSLARQQ